MYSICTDDYEYSSYEYYDTLEEAVEAGEKIMLSPNRGMIYLVNPNKSYIGLDGDTQHPIIRTIGHCDNIKDDNKPKELNEGEQNANY